MGDSKLDAVSDGAGGTDQIRSGRVSSSKPYVVRLCSGEVLGRFANQQEFEECIELILEGCPFDVDVEGSVCEIDNGDF